MQAGNFVEGRRGVWVEVHVLRSGEGVRKGVIQPATDQLPGPEEFPGLVSVTAQGVGKGRLGGLVIDTRRDPTGNQACNVTCEFRAHDGARQQSAFSKGAQGSGDFGAGLGVGGLRVKLRLAAKVQPESVWEASSRGRVARG